MAEFYELIRIYGLPESDTEEFQGLGAAALYNADDAQPFSGGQDVPDTSGSGSGTGSGGGTEGTEEEPIIIGVPAELWEAQNGTIGKQSGFAMQVAQSYIDKRDHLPDVDDNLFEQLKDLSVEVFLNFFAPWLVATVVGAPIAVLVEAVVILGIYSYRYIKNMYNAGYQLCVQIANENSVMTAIPNSVVNYELRNKTLLHHEESLKNLVAYVNQEEEHVRNIFPSDQFSELVQAVKDLRFNGASLQFPSGHVFSMVGGVVSEETTTVT